MDTLGVAGTLRILAAVFAVLLLAVCLPLVRAWRLEASGAGAA